MDDPDLAKLNSALCFDTPECKINGGVELFTTKPAGTDKKLYKALDKHLYTLQQDNLLSKNTNEEYTMASSVSPPTVSIFSPPLAFHSVPMSKSYSNSDYSTSPFGPLDQPASRRTFAYLISVLNATQPDHDFSTLTPEDFKREHSSAKVINSFNNVLFGLGMPVPVNLWEYIDTLIDIKECAIYSHTPPQTFLDDEPGTMWSIMWFFFNKRRKRVAYLHLKATRHHHLSPRLTSTEFQGRTSGRNSITQDDLINSNDNDEDYDLTYSSPEEEESYDDEVVGDLEMD